MSQLREMPVGGELSFPLERRIYLRTVCYDLKVGLGIQFSCRTDIDRNEYIVTRVA